MTQATTLMSLAEEMRACRVCRDAPFAGPPLPHEPRPIFQLHPHGKILVASQAPGIRAHASGRPFLDPSGERLRDWMGLDASQFYDPSKVLIAPMGFCFPGHTADKGDLPPRRECAMVWHDRLFATMPPVNLILAIGRYSQAYHFRRLGRPLAPDFRLDDLVRNWREFAEGSPSLFALPHPSWRNNAWLKRNPWFETQVLPALRAAITAALDETGEGADDPTSRSV